MPIADPANEEEEAVDGAGPDTPGTMAELATRASVVVDCVKGD
jgi:hypothetical protein